MLSVERPEEVVLVESSFEKDDSKNDMLGFGAGVEVALAITTLLPILKKLASTAADKFAEEWGHDLAEWLFAKGKTDHALNLQCLIELREAVVMRLRDQGFDPANAARIGDSVAAVMVSRPTLVRELIGK